MSDPEESSGGEKSSENSVLDQWEIKLKQAFECVQSIKGLLTLIKDPVEESDEEAVEESDEEADEESDEESDEETDEEDIQQKLEIFLRENTKLLEPLQILSDIKGALQALNGGNQDDKDTLMEILKVRPQNLDFVSSFEQMILTNRTWISDSTPATEKADDNNKNENPKNTIFDPVDDCVSDDNDST